MPQESADDRTYHGNRGLAPRCLVGLVRQMELEAMSERTWSVRISINDLNASIFLLESDAEVAAWARGLMRGLNSGDAKDGASKAYASGWEIGSAAREKADAIRAGLAENGRAGGVAKAGKRLADATAIATANASAVAVASALAEPRTKNQETKNKEQQEQTERPRRAAFTPPSEQEWVEYCTRTWSDWHPVCAGEAWAYYQGVGWIVGRKACKDWKSTARTAHGNARQWGKLQPQRQAWAPAAPPQITCKPGDLDGISEEETDRL